MITELDRPEFSLGIAVAKLGPKADRIRKLTDPRGEFWKKTPFVQELALAKAYFGFMERDEPINSSYLSNLSQVLRWINSVDAASLDGSARMRNRPGPLFLEEQDREAINQQIKNLNAFVLCPTAIFSLERFLTLSVRQLSKAGLSRPLVFAS